MMIMMIMNKLCAHICCCMLQATFPEQRQFLLTSSQGTFAGATTNW
jgi:hypothetical protein